MIIFCPYALNQKNIVVCLFSCPVARKRKCVEYEKQYEAILKEPIEQKYLDKYGTPDYPEPYGLVRKRRAAAAADKVAKEKKKLADKKAVRCKDHPRYAAVRKPRHDCKTCWAMYYAHHPEEKGKSRKRKA